HLVSFTGRPPTAPHTLPLHDALPILILARLAGSVIMSGFFAHKICPVPASISSADSAGMSNCKTPWADAAAGPRKSMDNISNTRSEEHTSELQSRENLVCRLLLEKKK